jgi:hypothetical protein
VILKHRALYETVEQVASRKWQERKQTNKKIKKGEKERVEDRKKGNGEVFRKKKTPNME